jgi:Arc/MetJ-type ribon-helix-helix transcriptional regulator
MPKAYKTDMARPVSISMKPKHMKKMDEQRKRKSRSEYIQGLIEADGDKFTVSDARTKQLLVALAMRDDLPDGLSPAFLMTVAEMCK